MRKTTIIVASVGALAIFGLSAAASYSFARPHGDNFGGPGMGHHGGKKMCGKRRGHKGRHHRRGMRRMLEQFDTNGDRKLTQTEIDEAIKAKLTKADGDGDGSLSLSEFQSVWLEMMRKKMVRHFQRLDEDGDAKVTLAEAQKPFEDVVERRDRNGDGTLDKQDRPRKRGWWRGHGKKPMGPEGGRRGPETPEGDRPE